MRYGLRLLIALSLAVAATVPALADANLSVIAGWRTLFHEVEWEPVEDQNVLGIMFDAGKASWPVRVDVAFQVSNEDSTIHHDCTGDETTRVKMTEGSVGVLRFFRSGAGRVRPYLGGGGVVIGATMYDNRHDGTSFAVYLRGGVLWRVGGGFSLGIDSRILLDSDIEHLHWSYNADYAQIGAIVRWEYHSNP